MSRSADQDSPYKPPKIRTFLVYAAGTLLVIGCSGRVISREGNNPSSVRDLYKSGNAADAVDINNPLPISLVSLPASETRLETFTSVVEAPAATHYRAAIVDGRDAPCNALGDLKPISEPLSVKIGKAGGKTLCIQAAHERGAFGKTTTYSFNKSEVSGNGPELVVEGVPPAYTASSAATLSVVSQDAVQYRASFGSILNPSAPCKTLEKFPWKDLSQAVSLKFEYDGPWQLCVEVRDSNGRTSTGPKAFQWTRDIVYPVVNPLPLPDAATTESQFQFNVTGNLVDFYQHILVEGSSTCAGVTYPALVPASTPLNLQIPKDGLWTLCLVTESKNGQRQQLPFVKEIRKVSPVVTPPVVNNPQPNTGEIGNPVAVVSLTPVALNNARVPLSSSRSFVISGVSVTHYKSFTYDFSNTCPDSPPATEATAASTPVNVSFSAGGIKTLCIWGINRAANGSETTQATATWFRFYNDTNFSSVGKNIANPTAMTARQAANSCSCHDFFFISDWTKRAVSVSQRLRNDSMPPAGWFGLDAEKASLMAFLATVPGYPIDLPIAPK
jgi:hypothetical protein